MNTRLSIIASLICSGIVTANADIADDARSLIDSGDYVSAHALLEPHVKGGGPRLAQLMGECLFFEGDYDNARPLLEEARRKGIADASLLLGRIAFLDYDFERAAELYAAYQKAAKQLPANPDLDPDLYSAQLSTAEDFMGRVEDVVIIDSIAVDADNLLAAFRLPPSAGSLRLPSVIPFEDAQESASMAFVSENGDYMMWAQPDDEGTSRLVESFRLTGGDWETPQMLDSTLNDGGDADYPFMMSDGTTLYFASDGAGSVGGYDIFVASRDASTGEFMQPQNIGFPYNSPYDDYMMAIDEENGIGWWATNRNRLDHKLTVYMFKVNELRQNLDPDSDDIAARARISSVAATVPEGMTLPAPMLTNVTNAAVKSVDFHIPMPGKKEYTSLSDFRNRQAAGVMKQYLELMRSYEADCRKLSDVRRRYSASPGDALAAEARALEKSVAGARRHLKSLRSEVYRLELGR